MWLLRSFLRTEAVKAFDVGWGEVRTPTLGSS